MSGDEGKEIRMSQGYRYLLLNKPYNVLTQFTLPSNAPDPPPLTLKAFIPVADVYAVGRLDRDSEGLLLLTNDGPWAARLIHPRYGHPRTYWVQVEGIPTPAALDRLREGVMIQGERTRPTQVQTLARDPQLPPRDPPIRVRQHIPTTWLELTLREGRNRQVRRMTAAVGLPTLRLVRIGLAGLTLAGLASGEWRDLTAAELKSLRRF